jgi:hypothetical protein
MKRSATAVVVTSILALAGAGIALPQSASAAGPSMTLKNHLSDGCMSQVVGPEGETIGQAVCGEEFRRIQNWEQIDAGGGETLFRNTFSLLCLAHQGVDTSTVDLLRCDPDDATQRWSVKSVAGGDGVIVKNVFTTCLLTLDGRWIVALPATGETKQIWDVIDRD